MQLNVTVGERIHWSHRTDVGTVIEIAEDFFAVEFSSGRNATYPTAWFTHDRIWKRPNSLTIVDTGEFVEFRDVPPADAPDTEGMTVAKAVALINSMVFMPEWSWIAQDYTRRFEGGIKIDVTYQARNSDRDKAPEYAEWTKGGGRASFVIQVTNCVTREDVLRKLVDEVIMGIFSHETREFLRYPDTLIAPFHPHNLDTIMAWGTPEVDWKFGAA